MYNFRVHLLGILLDKYLWCVHSYQRLYIYTLYINARACTSMYSYIHAYAFLNLRRIVDFLKPFPAGGLWSDAVFPT
jgi:hypothetical protein